MSRLKFRNIDAEPSDPVETWPTEGFIAALERGEIGDWHAIAVAVRRDPWGLAARRLEDALAVTKPYGIGPLMAQVLAGARDAREREERAEVAARVSGYLDASGLSRSEFASAIGTSASRLSTYLTGKVAPGSTLLLRMERLSKNLSGARSTAAR